VIQSPRLTVSMEPGPARSGVLARVLACGWSPCWRLFCPVLIFSCVSCSRITPGPGSASP